MWMYLENPGPFADGEVPQWVTDWLGRRKSPESTSKSNARAKKSSAGKSLVTAQLAEIEKPVDPQAEARLKAAAEKRSLATQQSISAGLDELQQWIGDQLRSGLANLLNEGSASCRTIAARLVDAKAQAMASRLDELLLA